MLNSIRPLDIFLIQEHKMLLVVVVFLSPLPFLWHNILTLTYVGGLYMMVRTIMLFKMCQFVPEIRFLIIDAT